MELIEKRDQILAAANRLFEMHGFHATGVDLLASEAGVTKRTLYKHFGSKEGLIEEVLRSHHTKMMERLRSEVLNTPSTGDAKLLACFELYRDWFSSLNFSGCIFIKTLNEFNVCAPQLSFIARESKEAMGHFLFELAELAGASEPRQLADQLQLLLEGSIVLAQAGRGPEIIDTAKAMAQTLITEAQS
ncbi:TetR/AcrR family transcriptional regulator [Coraliomargarita sp. SDUM461003]|uniref:TetR/AcrR family transcriptional regulator n=1 Tax=Thalassobacterium maritimum TaxID=3041265 RepID=A0ABU1AX39_9BACT|nr:TetR/AcrR family transcriptional regulator [Coraliomargarita sp. SDUM461003]MDQ8208724.1 TetR/AcrR family transcriptional regulator [Coraliomargarita sp. SDUM461003]